MIIKRGIISNLTGNVIVYWDLIPEDEPNENKKSEPPKKYHSKYNVLAINFVVSPLSVENKLLGTSFPPIPFKSFSDILNQIQNENCDIIYGGKVKFPKDNQKLDKFYKTQFNHYNKIIKLYISLYRNKFKPSTNISYMLQKQELDKLFFIENLVRKARSYKTSGIKKMLISAEIHEIISSLKKSNKYDFAFFLSILFKKGKTVNRILSLYIKLYIAIYYEKYEKAQKFQAKIEKMKSEVF